MVYGFTLIAFDHKRTQPDTVLTSKSKIITLHQETPSNLKRQVWLVPPGIAKVFNPGHLPGYCTFQRRPPMFPVPLVVHWDKHGTV